MKPSSCEVCSKAAPRSAWICWRCERLLPKEHINRLNIAARELVAAQRDAIAALKQIRRASA